MINKPALKYFLLVLLLIYAKLLSKYILFTRMHASPENYISMHHIKTSIDKGLRKANMKPFQTIKLMYRGGRINTESQYKNLGGNLFGFVPMGILLPLLFKRLRSFTAVVAVVFAVSLSYELIQLCTDLGVFDVDDLILNTAGGIIGFIIHYSATLIYREPLSKATVGM